MQGLPPSHGACWLGRTVSAGASAWSLSASLSDMSSSESTASVYCPTLLRAARRVEAAPAGATSFGATSDDVSDMVAQRLSRLTLCTALNIPCAAMLALAVAKLCRSALWPNRKGLPGVRETHAQQQLVLSHVHGCSKLNVEFETRDWSRVTHACRRAKRGSAFAVLVITQSRGLPSLQIVNLRRPKPDSPFAAVGNQAACSSVRHKHGTCRVPCTFLPCPPSRAQALHQGPPHQLRMPENSTAEHPIGADITGCVKILSIVQSVATGWPELNRSHGSWPVLRAPTVASFACRSAHALLTPFCRF